MMLAILEVGLYVVIGMFTLFLYHLAPSEDKIYSSSKNGNNQYQKSNPPPKENKTHFKELFYHIYNITLYFFLIYMYIII